jgi:hypothetical protein
MNGFWFSFLILINVIWAKGAKGNKSTARIKEKKGPLSSIII